MSWLQIADSLRYRYMERTGRVRNAVCGIRGQGPGVGFGRHSGFRYQGEQTVTVQAEMVEEGDGWDEGDYAVKEDVNVVLEKQ